MMQGIWKYFIGCFLGISLLAQSYFIVLSYICLLSMTGAGVIRNGEIFQFEFFAFIFNFWVPESVMLSSIITILMILLIKKALIEKRSLSVSFFTNVISHFAIYTLAVLALIFLILLSLPIKPSTNSTEYQIGSFILSISLPVFWFFLALRKYHIFCKQSTES